MNSNVEEDQGIDWPAVLADAARKTFNDTGHGLLLSRVPFVLRQQGIDIQQILQGRRLAPFLTTSAENHFHVIRNELNNALWAILPREVEPVNPHSQYFADPRTSNSENNLPLYNKAVWRCFVTELAPTFRRWINLSETIAFHDYPAAEDVVGLIEVDREYVRTDNLFKSNDEVSGNIQQWAAKHEIDLKLITQNESRSKGNSGIKNSSNPLIAFLNSLSADEAERIDIPADIVAKFAGLRLNR